MSIHEVLDLSIKSDVVYWCLFLFAFFLFARKSNLVPDSDNYVNKRFLSREDIQICENTLVVNVKWSKTIQFGERLLKIPLTEIFYVRSKHLDQCVKKYMPRIQIHYFHFQKGSVLLIHNIKVN